MSVSDQFNGLDMEQLIGAPLSAAADASMLLAQSTEEFIHKVGFDDKGQVRTATFSYQKSSVNKDGIEQMEEKQVEVPMLAIVPIPNLQVDEVNINFDMEVKQSEKQEVPQDLGDNMSGIANWGMGKVKVSGSISAHEQNTRGSDDFAKYHVDVHTTEHGIPEGLKKVLDMMAETMAPVKSKNNSEGDVEQKPSGQNKDDESHPVVDEEASENHSSH